LSRLEQEADEYQSNLLLYTAGAEAARIVEASAQYAVDKSCTSILAILEQYCIGEKNVIHERYMFNTRVQLAGESFDTFYSELRALAGRCGYSDYRAAAGVEATPADEMLWDRIVLGIRDDVLRKKLISEGNELTLASAVRLCRSSEVATAAMKSMGHPSTGSVDAIKSRNKPKSKSHLNKFQRKGDFPGHKQEVSSKNCTRCGKSAHAKAQCPAKNAECRVTRMGTMLGCVSLRVLMRCKRIQMSLCSKVSC
jgi:hypothetical protein